MIHKVITLFLFFLTIFSNIVFSQELQAVVNIDHEQIQNTEKNVFNDMKSNIQQFLNTKKWTTDKYAVTEKIKMNLNIKLQDQPEVGKFTALASVSFSRPVYGVGYETSVINYIDKDFNFNYTLSQPLEFNDNSYTTNLTSLLAFYIYVGLGMDYDSFAKFGGSVFFEKAQIVLNLAQASGDNGWQQFNENPNSRYWLNENINSPSFKDFREATYIYYRQGLDELAKKPDEGRGKIMDVLTMVKKIHEIKPNSCLLRTYFNTKGDEIIKILSEAPSADKGKAVDLLRVMDPTNTDNYEKLLK